MEAAEEGSKRRLLNQEVNSSVLQHHPSHHHHHHHHHAHHMPKRSSKPRLGTRGAREQEERLIHHPVPSSASYPVIAQSSVSSSSDPPRIPPLSRHFYPPPSTNNSGGGGFPKAPNGHPVQFAPAPPVPTAASAASATTSPHSPPSFHGLHRIRSSGSIPPSPPSSPSPGNPLARRQRRQFATFGPPLSAAATTTTTSVSLSPPSSPPPTPPPPPRQRLPLHLRGEDEERRSSLGRSHYEEIGNSAAAVPTVSSSCNGDNVDTLRSSTRPSRGEVVVASSNSYSSDFLSPATPREGVPPGISAAAAAAAASSSPSPPSLVGSLYPSFQVRIFLPDARNGQVSRSNSLETFAQDAAVQPDGNGLLPPPSGGVSGGSSRKVSIRESPVVEGGDGGAPTPSPCNATQTADGAASAHAAAASAHPHLGVKAYGVRLAPVIRDSFASYCRETTLHGWKYVTSGSSTSCEKSTWYEIQPILLRLFCKSNKSLFVPGCSSCSFP